MGGRIFRESGCFSLLQDVLLRRLAYRSTQVKAAVKVNAEKLLFNWELGRRGP